MNTKPQPFDDYAAGYDGHFTHSNIGRLQRRQAWDVFASLKLYNQNILEINCGTGEDAAHLSAEGNTVTGTDASAEMIKQASQKNPSIKFEQATFLQLKEKLGNSKFDLIFSNFGGLNCVPVDELKKLSSDFAGLLNDRGKLFVVVMGRKCKWEQIYFLLKGEREEAFRRKQNIGIKTTINGNTFNTYYYSPKEFITLFAPDFEIELVRPIGLFIPPSYLEPFFKKHTLTLKALNWLDKIFGGFGFIANHADHFVLVMTKKSNP
ncbi:MAG TPA: class I SAM-dependent methyltransferase [Chitinophagales bacterium]|nr:class I SAM-dependent methyltransferase [Chitinophagales bacterium]